RANLESVRLFNFCGEPLLPEHLRALFAARPDVLVQNTYGPTEATIAMTCLALRSSDFEAACDASVALGYWQDPEKTSAGFREIELAGSRRRGYFTGDWAERREGRLFFKERMDF